MPRLQITPPNPAPDPTQFIDELKEILQKKSQGGINPRKEVLKSKKGNF
jgi:hypothetical protein